MSNQGFDNLQNSEDVAISVASSPVSSVPSSVHTLPQDTTVIGPVPEVEEGFEIPPSSILTKNKRIIVGSVLLGMVILPFLGGLLGSYFVRNQIHQPEDPYNVWPETECRPNLHSGDLSEDFYDDQGYSTNPNSTLLLNNGDLPYYELVDKNNPNRSKVYMSIYLIENLFQGRDKFCLHIVSSTDPNDISPLIRDKHATHQYQLVDGSASSHSYFSYEGYSYSYFHEYGSGFSRKTSVIEEFGEMILKNNASPPSQSDCSTLKKAFAEQVQSFINDDPLKFYRNHKTIGYMFADYTDILNIPILKELVQVRNANRDEAEAELIASLKNNDDDQKIPEKKPRFKHIFIRSASE